MPSINDAFQRPLGTEHGALPDRTRAMALIDRIEQHLERGVATIIVTAGIHQHLDGVRDLIRRYRDRLAGLPEHE